METSEADLQVTATTMSYWLQFAKTGDPNSPTTVRAGLTFRNRDFSVQEINSPARTIDAPESELCRIYREELHESR